MNKRKAGLGLTFLTAVLMFVMAMVTMFAPAPVKAETISVTSFSGVIEEANKMTGVQPVTNYVAKINGNYYETLKDALENALDGENVVVLKDNKITEVINVDTSVTLDLNGYTVTVEGVVGSRAIVLVGGCNEFVVEANGGAINSEDGKSYGIIDVNTTAKLTVNGGTYDYDTNNGGLFKFRAFDSKITLNDVEVYTNGQITGPNYSGNELVVNGGYFSAINGYNARNIFAFYVAYAKATFTDMVMENEYIGGIECWASTAVLNDCSVSILGTNSAPFLSTAVAAEGNTSNVTINGGVYKTAPKYTSDANGQGATHGSWTVMIMSSGGTLTINDGEFTNDNYGDTTATNPRGVISVGSDSDYGYGSTVNSKLIINGGKFNSIGNVVDCETIWNDVGPATMAIEINGGEFEYAGKVIGGCDPISTGNPVEVAISGGTYCEIESLMAGDGQYLVDGFKVAQLDNGSYAVQEIIYATYEVGAGKAFATLADAIAQAKADKADYVGYLIHGAVELETGFSHGIVDLEDANMLSESPVVVFMGMTADAKLTIVGGGVPDIKGVHFANLAFHDEGTYLTTANEFMYQNFIDCTFENVTFYDGIRLSGDCVLINCTIEADTYNEYAVWMDDGNFYIENTVVNARDDAYGMLKSDSAETITLYGNTFEYHGVANKEVINTKGAEIVANNNKFIDCDAGIIPEDKVNVVNGKTDVDEIKQEIAQTNQVIINYAMIGETKYETLQDAVDSAVAGDKIVLTRNVDLEGATLNVAQGKEIVLDLNGYTISGASDVQGHSLIINKGTLTIINGTVSYGYIGAKDGSYGRGNYTITNSGTLTIDGNAVIENVTAFTGHMHDAIDNNSTTGNAKLVINSGIVRDEKYIAIRQFANSSSFTNEVIVNGGEIVGGYRGVWVQLPGSDASKAVNASTIVNDGVITSLDSVYNHAIYVLSKGNDAQNTVLNINGGTFNGDVAINGTASATMKEENLAVTGGDFEGLYGVYGYGDIDFGFVSGGNFGIYFDTSYVDENSNFVMNQDGTFGVGQDADMSVAIARIGNAYYSDFAVALGYVAEGETITLVSDITLTSVWKLDGKSFNIDGDGYTITGNGALWFLNETYEIKNVVFDYIKDSTINGILEFDYANVTVTDCTFTNNVAKSIIAVDYNADNDGNSNVVIENCDINNNQLSVCVINVSEGEVTVKDSTIADNTADIAVIYSGSDIIVTGNEFSGNTLNGTNANKATVLAGPYRLVGGGDFTVEINGNAFLDTDRAVFVESWADAHGVNSTFDLDGNYWNGTEPNVGRSGDPVVVLDNYYANMQPTANGFVLSNMVGIVYEAQVGNTKYETYKEAYKVASAGDTINLLKDITASDIIVIDKEIVLNGNGFAIKSTAPRAINVDCLGTVTIKDLTVIGGGYDVTERGINLINKPVTLELENVEVKDAKYGINYTVACSTATVNAKDCNISGYIAVNFTSDGATFNAVDTELVGINNYEGDANSVAVIQNSVSATNTTVNVVGGKIVAVKNGTAIIAIIGENATAGTMNATLDTELVVADYLAAFGDLDEITLNVRAEYAQYLMDEGYAVEEAQGSGLITISGIATIAIGNQKYLTLAKAIASLTTGDVEIDFLTDITEDVTVEQKENLNIVIDGNDYDLTGTITIDGNSRYYDSETLTIKNINFYTDKASGYFINGIYVDSTTRYPHNVTIENCDFISTYVEANGVENKFGAINIHQAVNINVYNVTANGVHSLLQAKGVANLTVDGAVVNAEKGISLGTSVNATIKNIEINSNDYGIRADGDGDRVATLENVTITAPVPVVVRYATKAYTVVLEGTNTFNETNANGYQVVFTTGNDDKPFTAPTGNVKLIGAEVDNLSVYGMIVRIDGDRSFLNADEAFAYVAENGGTITLLDDVTLTEAVKIKANVTLELNGYTLTLPAVSNYAIVIHDTLTVNGDGKVVAEGLYGIGTSTSCTGGLVINGGEFVQANGDYLIGAFGGKVVINDGKFYSSYCVINSFDGYTATAEILGGEFEATVDGAIFYGINLKVSGGTFGEPIPEEHWKDGYIVIERDGKYVTITLYEYQTMALEVLVLVAEDVVKSDVYNEQGLNCFNEILLLAENDLYNNTFFKAEVDELVRVYTAMFDTVLNAFEQQEVVLDAVIRIKDYAELKNVSIEAQAIIDALNVVVAQATKINVQLATLYAYDVIDGIADAMATALKEAKQNAINELFGANGENVNNVTSAMIASINVCKTIEEVETALTVAKTELQEIIIYKGYIKNASEKADTMSQALADMKQALADIIEALGVDGEILKQIGLAKEQIDLIKQDTQNIINNTYTKTELDEKLKETNEAIAKVTSDVKSYLDEKIIPAIEENARAVEKVKKAIIEHIDKFKDSLGKELSSLRKKIEGIKTLTADDIRNALSGELGTIGDNLGQIATNISGVNTTISTAMAQIKGLIDGYKGEVDRVVAEVQNIVTNLQGLSSTIDSLTTVVQNAQGAADRAQQTADTASKALAELTKALEDNTTSITELAQVANSALEAAQRAEEAAKSAMEKAQTAEVKAHASITETELKAWLDKYLQDLQTAQSPELLRANFTEIATDTYREELIEKLAVSYSKENAALVLAYYDQAIAQINASVTKEDIDYALATFKSNVSLVDTLVTLAPTPAYNDQSLVTLLIVVIAVEAVIAIVAVVALILVAKSKKKVGGDDDNTPEKEIVLEETTEPETEEVVTVATEETAEEVVEESKEEPAEVSVSQEETETESEDDNAFAGINGVSKTFEEKLIEADEVIKDGYKLITEELLSYKKVNPRLSKKALSFRTGRTLIAKMTIVGKTLKVYYALNPMDYDVNKFFQKDASDKKAYEEVPMLMRVKSGRGAKKTAGLVADLAEKFGLVKKPEGAPIDTRFAFLHKSNLTFEDKLVTAELVVKQGYEEIKQNLLTYKKVNPRLSKKAMSFRKGRTLIAKMTIVGKTLRVYLALDPKNYDVKKFFQKDASDKKAYEEVPMLMRVRSPRSIKRVNNLIPELEKAHELVKKPEPKE